MKDVIQTYLLPYDPDYPVVCFDEASKQLFGEVRGRLPTRPGSPAKQDYEYERLARIIHAPTLEGFPERVK
jgi:hypothetical protein